MDEQVVVLTLAGVLAGGVAAQWLAWRLRIPSVVLLLAGGLVAGPLTGVLDPDATFGDLLFPFVSIAVAVVLFEGSLALGTHGVRRAGTTVWLLLTVGAGITLAGTAIAARAILDVEWSLAVLLAAVLVVTGPTVVGPIVRSLRLDGRVAAILEAEGTLIDPIGAVLTVLVFEALFSDHRASGDALVLQLATTLGVGAVVGIAFAGLLVLALARYLVPDELHNTFTLSIVVGSFATANWLSHESGLVAVTVLGIALASQRRVAVRHVLEFNETLRVIFIAGLFVLLGARIEAETLRTIEWQNIAFLATLVLVVRPLAVLLSTLRSDLTWGERAFLAATAPRGIVAAAIASIFSLRLADLGFTDAQVVVSATFTVIAGTVLLSGLAGRLLARRFGLVTTAAAPIVILGANRVARAMAAAIEGAGGVARLIDLDRTELIEAQGAGLSVHRGTVFSDDTWEAAGLGSAEAFVAMTASDELNALAAQQAASRLGRSGVYQLPPMRPEHRSWRRPPTWAFARQLFDSSATMPMLDERFSAGWEIRLVPPDAVDDETIPVFTVDAGGRIRLVSVDAPRARRRVARVAVLCPPPSDRTTSHV